MANGAAKKGPSKKGPAKKVPAKTGAVGHRAQKKVPAKPRGAVKASLRKRATNTSKRVQGELTGDKGASGVPSSTRKRPSRGGRLGALPTFDEILTDAVR